MKNILRWSLCLAACLAVCSGCTRSTRSQETENGEMVESTEPRVEYYYEPTMTYFPTMVDQYPGSLSEAIANGILIKGMTREQVSKALGRPINAMSTAYSEGRYDVWIYSTQPTGDPAGSYVRRFEHPSWKYYDFRYDVRYAHYYELQYQSDNRRGYSFMYFKDGILVDLQSPSEVPHFDTINRALKRYEDTQIEGR